MIAMVLAIALVLGRYLISNELLLLWSPDPETRLYELYGADINIYQFR